MEIFTMNLSPESKLILLYLEKVKYAKIEDIAYILKKSIRTAYRYVKELGNMIVLKNFSYSLSNLSLVVDVNINTTTTKDLDQNTLEWRDKVGDLLDRYGKKLLLDEVLKRIPEQNIAALEYLLKDAVSKEKQRLIKTNFTRLSLLKRINHIIAIFSIKLINIIYCF